MTARNKKKIITDWFELLNGLIPPGRTVMMPVLTGSMMPLIPPGSRVIIRASSGTEICIGDIIVFREGSSLTTHRLLARIRISGKGLLYQKGDANQFGNWIEDDHVVGIVTAIENTAGVSIDISDVKFRKKAVREAYHQLALTFLNTILLIPRKIKRWLKEK